MAQIILPGSKYVISWANIHIAATAKIVVSVMGTASDKTQPEVMVIDLFVLGAQTEPDRAMHVGTFNDIQ